MEKEVLHGDDLPFGPESELPPADSHEGGIPLNAPVISSFGEAPPVGGYTEDEPLNDGSDMVYRAKRTGTNQFGGAVYDLKLVHKDEEKD